MQVLVTGSSGFIGRNLVNKLKDNYAITELNDSDGDICSSNYFEKLKGKQISHIFHLAAKTYIPDSWENPYQFLCTNLMGTINTLEYCRNQSITLTYFSAYIYGNQPLMPISENVAAEPNNPYSFSKYMAEKVCEFYSREYSVRLTILRPFNVYGIGQASNWLIPTILNQCLDNRVYKNKINK